MAEFAASQGILLRPHAKTHKTPQIAALQLEAGAVGLTVAKLSEAEVFSAAAFPDGRDHRHHPLSNPAP